MPFIRTNRVSRIDHLLIVTHSELAKTAVEKARLNSYGEYKITGIILIDENGEKSIDGIPIVCPYNEASSYMIDKWIDAVLFYLPEGMKAPSNLLDNCLEMGIVTHTRLDIGREFSPMRTVEKYAGCTVLTQSMRIVPLSWFFLKRVIDICGSIVGLVITAALVLIVGPLIYLSDSGPIFFSQPRVEKTEGFFKFITSLRNFSNSHFVINQQLLRFRSPECRLFFVQGEQRG